MHPVETYGNVRSQVTIGIVLLAGCMNPSPMQRPDENFPTPEHLNVRTLAVGQLSFINDVTRSVIVNSSAWASFWLSHTRNESSTPPPVNFDTEEVIAVVFEEKPADCSAVRVTNVTWDPKSGVGHVEVTRFNQEDLNCIEQQPFHFVAIAHRDGRFEFNNTARRPGSPPDAPSYA